MFLLLQVDAPIPERPQIDRIIYVFACNTRICTEGFLKDAENGAFSVIIQIRQSQEDIKTSFADRVVEKKSFFDDLMDDTPDETKVLGPIKPNDDNIRSVSNVFKTIGIHDEQPFFPPIRLRIVEELIASSSRIGTKPSKNGDFSATNYKIEDANPEEVYEQMEVSGYDKFFKAFHTRVSHYPRQCVRYAPDSKPLIFSETSHLENPNAANLTCSCTGPSKPMSFDLQLMPAILSILPTNTEQNLRHIPKEKRATHQLFGDGMEWGTVLVYTCHICCAKGRVRVHTEQ